MRTSRETVPLSFIHQWAPVQDLRRLFAWLALVGAMTVIACAVLRITDLYTVALMFVAGSYLGLQSQRVVAPERLTIEGLPAASAVRAISTVLEANSPGKYHFDEERQLWRYYRTSSLYGWDPIVRIQTTEPEFVLQGPSLTIATLERLLHQHVRQ